MSAIDDNVHAQLQLLASMRLEGMEPDARQKWQDKIDDLANQYDAARRKEKDDKSSAAEKKYAKDLGDSIAKGLPAIVKGLQAAISAFDKGDAVTGSAAIMDICAAAAPIISAMLAATGPEGMLVGSLFSVIGQILSFFAPKQPSLKDQIQKMLQELDAEQQLQGLGAISLANEVRDRELTTICRNLSGHTRLSLLVREAEKAEFDDFEKLRGKTIIVARDSSAAADAKARYPNCTIQFVDEVANGRRDAREYIVRTLIAEHRADALCGLDMSNRTLRDECGGVALADTHPDPQRQPSILELPLLTEDDADAFEARMKALNFAIWRAQAKADHAAFKNWEVAAWLKMKEKQNNPKWPEVLGVWCRTYNDLIVSNIKFNCLIDPEVVRKLVRYTHEADGGCPLPTHRKMTIHGLLTDLQGLALDLRTESAACNGVALGVLDDVIPAAQGWGLFAHLGTNHGLYFTSGAANLSHWTDRSDTNYYHVMNIAPAVTSGDDGSPRKAQFDLKPRYHCLILKSNSSEYPSNHSWLDHLRVRPDTFAIDDMRLIRDNPMFFDICGVERSGQLECWAIPGGRDRIERWSLDKANDFKILPGSLVPTRASVLQNVRACYPMLDSLLQDDPDSAAIDPGAAWFNPGHAAYSALVYAGLRASADIYVHGSNEGHYVPSPWSEYTGIAVDKNYLWVFSHWGLACATHASVVACILQKIKTPRWMQYSIPNKMLGRYPYFDNRGIRREDRDGWAELGHATDVKGLVSLSPCADGTMLASVVYRSFSAHQNPYTHTWNVFDVPKTYTTHYTIDVARQSIQIVEPWVKLEGSAWQVQKMPIPCWSLMSSLKVKLEFLQAKG